MDKSKAYKKYHSEKAVEFKGLDLKEDQDADLPGLRLKPGSTFTPTKAQRGKKNG